MVKKRHSRKSSRKIMKGGSSCSSCSTVNPIFKGGSRKRKGGNATLLNLAYTGKNSQHFANNPNLAYTGSSNIAKAYPNPGFSLPNGSSYFMNPLQTQNGGKYPNGLTGDEITPSADSWPGVNGISGDGNHYPINTYDNDVSRQMMDVGPAPPYAIGGKRRRSKKYLRSKKGKRSKRQSRSKRGGFFFHDNSLVQDAVNVGRQFSTGLGGIVNGVRGFQAPVSPLPWKGQLQNEVNLNTLKYKTN